MSNDRPSVVRAAELVEPHGASTPGLTRRQAFSSEGRWIGLVITEPCVMSGWHDHGDNETFLYMLRGEIALEFARGGNGRVVAAEGDFVLLSRRLAHREARRPAIRPRSSSFGSVEARWSSRSMAPHQAESRPLRSSPPTT